MKTLAVIVLCFAVLGAACTSAPIAYDNHHAIWLEKVKKGFYD